MSRRFVACVGGIALAGLVGARGAARADEPGKPTDGAPAAEVKAAAGDLTALSMDELIARLPEAGDERRWNAKASKYIEAPASAEMARRMATQKLTDEQWRRVLIEKGAVRFRAKWPKDEKYAVSMIVPEWLGVTQIRLKPRVEGMEGIEAGETMMGISGTVPMMRERDARLGQAMGKVPEGTKEIVFDVEVERGTSMMDALRDVEKEDVKDGQKKKPPRPAPGIIWKGTLTTPVELVASWDEAVPARSGAELDKGVRDAIGAGVRQWASNPTVPYAMIDPDCEKFPAFADMALALKAELVSVDGPNSERVLAEEVLIAHNSDPLSIIASARSAEKRYYGSTNFDVQGDVSDTSKWRLRLTGADPKYVWFLWHAKTRWNGKIEIPWAEAVAHEKEMAGANGRGPEISVPHMK